MKQSIALILLLGLCLTACTPGNSEATCKEGICISIETDGPVQAETPVRFVITLTTEKAVSDLPVGLLMLPHIKVTDLEEPPDNAKLTYQDETNVSWRINTREGEEYIFSGYLILPKPSVSYGVFSYVVDAYFSQPAHGWVTDALRIYLDAEGNQLDADAAKAEMESGLPVLPTAEPELVSTMAARAQSMTPRPSAVTATPTPTHTPQATSTPPAYPGPGEAVATESAGRGQPASTLPAYPTP